MNTKIFDLNNKSDVYYKCDRAEMIDFIPSESVRILDVGCGTANFGKLLKSKRSVEVWGVELNDCVAKEAMVKIDKVIIGDIENDNLSIPRQYFDCIVFNDVLEHLKYPWNVLRKSSEYLKNSGYIIASVPNMRYFNVFKPFLLHKEWDYGDEGVLDKTHLRFFTEKSIKNMFQFCNYRVIAIQGIYPITFPWKFRIVNILLGRMFEDARFQRFVCVVRKES